MQIGQRRGLVGDRLRAIVIGRDRDMARRHHLLNGADVVFREGRIELGRGLVDGIDLFGIARARRESDEG